MPHLPDSLDTKINDIVKKEIKVGNDSATVKVIDLLFESALKLKTSDIHLDFGGSTCNVRFRVDGFLNNIASLPSDLAIKIISRIKVISGMDITQTRLPQDGSKTLNYNGKSIDIRVATLPAKCGESVVLRILPKGYTGLGLNELGLLEEDYKKVKEVISKKWGMVLVVGPTGCGKTTTLYAILKEINDSSLNIVSLEDPIECELPFVRQSQIRSDIGYSFLNALRSVLRQDPDVIMIGEIRDEETLKTAFKAALTGHLVFSTLHTKDTIETISRLREMGLPNYIISSALKGIIAQRLVRKNCVDCNGSGCNICDYKGLKDRVGLFEVLSLDEDIANLILNNCSVKIIKEQLLKGGFCTFSSDAKDKIGRNIISKDEVLRILEKYD